MKIFKTEQLALQSLVEKEMYYLNGFCPYTEYGKVVDRLCGNWCALFYYDKGNENTSPYVILGCKAGEKYLYVEKLVED